MNWHTLKCLLLQLMLLYVECALSSLRRLISEVFLFLFFLFSFSTIQFIFCVFFSFFSFCLRDVEELVHGIRGLLDFPVSSLVHCFTVPDFLYLWAEQYNHCY